MNNNCTYIEDKILRDYMKTFSLQNLLIGTGYEILCALLIKLLFEEIFKVSCLIGFKIKPKYIDKHISPKTVEEFDIFLRKFADNDSLFDFVVGIISSFNEKRKKIAGWSFQIKRFGKYQSEKDTTGLINFLKDLKNKYPQNSSSLVIFFDGHKGINPKVVCESEELKNFPFNSIFMIEVNKTNTGDKQWVLHMGNLWPIYGYNEYDPVEAIKRGVLRKINRAKKTSTETGQ